MDPWSSLTTAALASTRPFVVHVNCLDLAESRASVGSGVLLDHYHVVSNSQITGSGGEITVHTWGDRKYRATVVGDDPLYFLSVLRLETRLDLPLPSLQVIEPGMLALAVGNPFGTEWTATLGMISAVERTIYRPERFPVDGLIITDTVIHPGNTGGALVDLEGHLTGVNGIPWIHGLSLAVQADVVGRIANQIIEYGSATHAWLGFSGQPEVVEPTLAKLLGLPADRGVSVGYVAPDGPGSRAGVQVMDLVVQVDGRQATALGAIRKALSLHRPGEEVPLTVLRKGELVELSFPVEEIPNLRE
ncbi:MAG: trypsin-like peptidase domain-containing protein [Thermaerobacter sp.]|nr:trypsin-like peptidase domain-containing protein [Thermaerobacter sp.]